MREWVKDAILSTVLIIISIATYFVSKDYPDIASHFPVRLALVLGALSVGLLIKAVFITRVKETEKIQDLSSLKNVFIVVFGIALYTISLRYLGYLISSFCLLLFLISFLGFTRKLHLIITTFGCVMVVYVAFKMILGVPLPLGLFFQG